MNYGSTSMTFSSDQMFFPAEETTYYSSNGPVSFNIASTSGLTTYADTGGTTFHVTYATTDWGETEPKPDPGYKIWKPEPEDPRICKWCGSEFFPSKNYPGNCNSCGGPRLYTYTRKGYTTTIERAVAKKYG